MNFINTNGCTTLGRWTIGRGKLGYGTIGRNENWVPYIWVQEHLFVNLD